MEITHYMSVGFKKVGALIKDSTVGKKKHHTYASFDKEFIANKKSGVYLIERDGVICKIGESEDLLNRFNNYQAHTGITNVFVRDSMDEGLNYGIYFIECPSVEVYYAGIPAKISISYKTLEKDLIRQYLDVVGVYPVWNKGIQ